MALKRTMTVTWDGLHELEAEDDDDEFFESSNRLSTIVPLNLSTSVPIPNSLSRRSFRDELMVLSDDDDDDDEDFIDTRMSFTASVPIPIRNSFRRSFRNSIIRHSFRAPSNDPGPPEVVFPGEQMETYGIWMAAPDSIMERRKRLLQGMGLNNSKKDLNRLTTARFVSKKFKENQFSRPPIPLPNPTPNSNSNSTPSSNSNSNSNPNSNYNYNSTPAAAHPPRTYSTSAAAPSRVPIPVPVAVPVPVPVTPTTDPKSTTPPSATATPPSATTTPDTSQQADENQTQSQSPEVQAENNPSSNSSPSQSPHSPEFSPDELSASSSSSVTPTSHSVPVILFRSRSDSDISIYSIHTKRRKEEIIGKGVSTQKLTRTSSTLAPCARLCRLNINSIKIIRGSREAMEIGLDSTSDTQDYHNNNTASAAAAAGNLSAFFLIKNLDTGKEFIVKEFDDEGMWNRLSDMETGKQLTREEFEKSVGHSPLVKELMRRQSWKAPVIRKAVMNNYLTKSFRMSKKKGSSMLKNIKSKAHSMRSGMNVLDGKDHHHHSHSQKENHGSDTKDKEKEKDKEKDKEKEKDKDKEKEKEKEQKPPLASASLAPGEVTKGPSPEWVKVRQQGKAYKDLTALRLSQEIEAHEGSIWTIKFDPEGKYLASAGEDKVIHIWEVQECEVASLITQEDQSAAAGATATSLGAVALAAQQKKGKSASKKGGVVPEYVQLPETAFAFSEKPVCSFNGHLDDVLDLSWSNKRLQLLSSSMDKTVRLWDLETKTCLKLFAHNDYVTCLQFNPTNDNYFISGSLDAKLRIWNVAERRVIDWIDLHEMVTAACYSLDGQTAAVGSHKGTCRMYSTADGKLTQTSTFDVPNKNKKKVTKITGFEFTPENPSEVMVTSADSRIRIYEGTDIVQKFRGYKNTSSQIVASYSPSAKHIICASEDSNVYVWRREEPRPNTNPGKARVALDISQFEQFQCKDVSVAVPWPGSSKYSNDKPGAATSSPTKSDGNNNANKKQQLPPLPKKNKQQQQQNSEQDKSQDDEKEKSNGDADQNGEKDSPASGEAETGASGGGGESSSGGDVSASAAPAAAPTHRSTPSWPSGWGWQGVGVGGWQGVGVGVGGWQGVGVGVGGMGGGGQPSGGDPAAWGLVIVTAGQGGDLKIYQNFGLPVRVGSLFS